MILLRQKTYALSPETLKRASKLGIKITKSPEVEKVAAAGIKKGVNGKLIRGLGTELQHSHGVGVNELIEAKGALRKAHGTGWGYTKVGDKYRFLG